MAVFLCNIKHQITLLKVCNMAKDKNIFAAIVLALHEFKGNNVHDKESGIITIKERNTLWNAKFLSFTNKP
ncbi:hypothetical protein HMPREF0663_12114 [Hoylesella oralis ATCC 33269]|uniref:NHR domain-containing protein n=2 Tax=Hoylesella oralis TaxID=28134 RepID=E7RS46_9BACT|nr:hypothetical protein HMPREF0663_12114 [Hoylesella oralis ATCC 33269]